MSRGAAAVITRLHAEGSLQGVAGLGGTRGSAVVSAALRSLPVGVAVPWSDACAARVPDRRSGAEHGGVVRGIAFARKHGATLELA